MTVAALLETARGCPKCGGEDISTAYHKQPCDKPHCSCSECLYGSHAEAHGEHLHHTCRRCLFDWLAPVKGKRAVKDVRKGSVAA